MQLPNIQVPRAVQRAAESALALHRELALPVEQEVSGVALAERLASGSVAAEDVGALARFFQVNERRYGACLQAFRSARTDGLCRSWALRGGEHGRVWAERQRDALVREGILPADPYAALLRAEPDEVYARFAVGAFRWEYGIDTPGKAARFYEDYHRATGKVLDLHSAFGPSGESVAIAIRRRVYGENPFDALRRAMQFEDAEYRLAAMVDEQELRATGQLDENIKPFLLQGPGDPLKSTIKFVWPTFIAYLILAAEKPELLADLHGESKKPPTLSQEPTSLLHYSDAARIYIAFFHPKGAYWKETAGTDFEDLPSQIENLMLRAHVGRKLIPLQVQKILGAARRWTAENKIAGSLFHVYNADWKKGNWQNILDALPLDVDVRGPFQKFVDDAPVPADGVKLQQTISDKTQLKAIAKHFFVSDPDALEQRKVGSTPFGIATEKLGRPVGIYSVIRTGVIDRTMLGCFERPEGWVFVLQSTSGAIVNVPIEEALGQLNAGNWTVTKAHKDMKLGYGASASSSGPKAAAMATPTNIGGEAPPAISKEANPDTAISKPVATPSFAPLKDHSAAGLVPATPKAVPVANPKEPFGFDVDEVVEIPGSAGGPVFYWVREVTPFAYRAILLRVTDGAASVPVSLLKEKLEKGVSRGRFTKAESIAPFVTIYGPVTIGGKETSFVDSTSLVFLPAGPALSPGVETSDGVVVRVFEAVLPGSETKHPVIVLFDGSALRVKTHLVPAPKSSYAPTDPKPESNLSEEANELSGTQQAFDWLAQKGWTPVVASDGAGQFKLALAGVYQYGALKTRTILGYGKSEQGGLVYVIRTEKGTVNWKSVAGGNTDYAPLLKTDDIVLGELLPLPGTGSAKFPKLNYRLSNKARTVAKENGLVYQPAPKDAPFRVGVPLTTSGGLMTTRILGWVKGPTGMEAVIDEGGQSDYGVVSVTTLKQLSLIYERGTELSATGEVVFGKKAGSAAVSVVNAFEPKAPISLPSTPPAGWDSPAPVDEPTMAKPASGKHVAAGILAVFPAGTKISSGTGLFLSTFPSVVLCYPSGAYGGYTLGIPKGTVDHGESPLLAAVREFNEETGLTAKPVAHLGDFRASTSVVRLYVGFVTGGNPVAKPKNDEVDAVTLKPLTDIDSSGFQNEKWWSDLVPSGGSNWQQDAVTKLVAWLMQNGMPQTYGPKSTPSAHSQVTHPADVPSSTPLSPALFSGTLIPQEPDTDVWKTLLFKAPFPVTTAMVTALKAKVKSGTAAEPTSFSAAKARTVGPVFGQVFETSAGTPYTAAGYVSWLGTDGKDYHYLLGLSGAGLVEALPVAANGTSDLHVSATDTESLSSKDPWYSHPDPSVMARMKLIWDAKGALAPAKVNMQTFKLNWLKEAGVPYYAVASSNILQELSGLFVPGALTEAQKDAVIACLKARMTATQSGKKSKGSAPVLASPFAPSAPAAPSAPPKPKVTIDKTHLSPSALATLSYPESAQLTPVNATKVSSSSKPSRVVQDQHGNKFFVKWRKGESWQAETDRAASLLMVKVKGGVVPVNAFDYEGNRASIQPFFETAEPTPSNPNDLSDANKAELLSQHAFDMFVGDHDGHGGNWIQVGSKIIAVDRGQSFKFLLQGTEESLDPKWHAPGNIGIGYAKQLLIEWGKRSASIPVSAFSAMRATIEAIQAQFTTSTLKPILAAMVAARGMSASEETAMLAKLEKRRASYLDDWTTVLRKLQKDFAWPGSSGGLKLDFSQLTVSPAEMAFGKQEETTIAEAKKAGWQGKSLRVDGPWVENQEVMCKAVLWEDSGSKTPATLIHFRLTKAAGLRAAQALLSSGVVEVSDGPGGPQRLAVDKANSIYEKLFAAIKTINYHLTGPKPDGVPNQTTVAAAVALKPMLQQILEQSKDPKGTFSQTSEPNEAVNAMADQYLGYVSTIEYWNANATTLIGQHSPVFTEFVFEEPPENKKPKPKKSFQAKLKNQGASYPNITNDAGQIVVRNLHKPVVNSSQVSQFVIEDPKTGAKLFFNPTAQSGDIKAGVQGVKGLCWGVLPGEPSAHVVVHLLKLFSDATSVPMNRATEADQRVLYLAKQAAALQGGGVFKPTADGTALVEPEVVAAMSAYEGGDHATAAKKLVNFIAGKAGMPPEDVLDAAKQDAAGMHDARGAGFYRHNRIGWDTNRVKEVLGKTTYVAHALLGHSTTVQFFKDVAVNGALLANEVKPFYGVVKDGASPSSDFAQGGSQGIFCCLRKSGFYPKHLYFDLSLALRLDVYMVGTGDSFGNVHTERRTMPDKWTVGSGPIGASSSGQLLVRHDIDLQTYLVVAKCGSQSEADQCIALVKQLGWKFRAGPPEKIFIA